MVPLWRRRRVSICLLRDIVVAQQAILRGKAILEEIVKMLFKMLDQLGCRIAEDPAEYGEIADEEEEVEEDQADHYCPTTEIELARAIVSASHCRRLGNHL